MFLYHFYEDALCVSKSVIMNMSSLIFSWLISVGLIVFMKTMRISFNGYYM